tara:strand:+ start:5927 stop:6298 length:372 start_codon:yes stop_codon:yes gene_type:complete
MSIWKKVDLTQPPFFFSEERDGHGSDYLSGEYAAVYNKQIQKELAGKNLEYLWGEEILEEPDYLEEFECDGWEKIFSISADHCSHFGYVTMAEGSPHHRIRFHHKIRWAIHFEMLMPIWIREV